MLGYIPLASCAFASHAAANTTTSPNLLSFIGHVLLFALAPWFAYLSATIVKSWRLLIFVVTAHKIHRRLLIPSFGCAIKNHKRADQLLAAAGIARIRMKDVAGAVLVER